ncbi:hypothetical protein [Sinomonas mesophila]|uniref:hypothetical protein n=1 Tax=Sinomonas mesophila TaxID=1531955 RepID=UPI00098692E9|nr:hypothetical protein [Sinomonas mesophila]
MNATRDQDGLGAVDQLLAELKADDAAVLRPVLTGLRSLGKGDPVEPSPAVRALLASADEAPAAPVVSLDAAREKRGRRTAGGRRRTLVASLALTGVLGVGTAAAAVADAGFRESLSQGIATIVGTITGSPAPAPAPQSPPAPELPASADVATEIPAAPTPTSAPTTPGAATAPAGAPASSAAPTQGLNAPSLPSLPIDAPLTPPTLPAELPAPPAGTLPSADTGGVSGTRVP